MIEGSVGQPVLLELVLADRATGLYPRARVLDASGVQIGVPVDLTPAPASPGLYVGSKAFTEAGEYVAVYDTYTDAGHSTLSSHEPGEDHIRIHAVSQDAAFLRTLGHLGENVRDDVLAYDLATGRPTTFRRRLFPDKATADASTPNGLGEGEIAVIVGTAEHLDAQKWNTLLRTLTP